MKNMVGDRKVLHFRRKTIEPDRGDTHPLMTTQLSSIIPQKNKGSKKVVKLKTKSPASFIDPLQAATDEIDISNEVNEDVSRETEDAWRKLMTSVNENNATSKIKIQPPLHEILITKLNKSDSSISTNTPEARLDWLESNRSGGTEISADGITQQEFILFMEACNQHLSKCWLEDHRVQVVKTAIQLAKMLAPEEDVMTVDDVFQTIYFSVTDLITFFGKMVYDRLASKCPTLRVNFCYEDVSAQAKELCKVKYKTHFCSKIKSQTYSSSFFPLSRTGCIKLLVFENLFLGFTLRLRY